jgi:hypothetical protein
VGITTTDKDVHPSNVLLKILELTVAGNLTYSKSVKLLSELVEFAFE